MVLRAISEGFQVQSIPYTVEYCTVVVEIEQLTLNHAGQESSFAVETSIYSHQAFYMGLTYLPEMVVRL